LDLIDLIGSSYEITKSPKEIFELNIYSFEIKYVGYWKKSKKRIMIV